MLFNAEQELGGIPLFSYGNINDDIITIINNKLTAYYTKSQTDFLLLSKVDLSVFNNYQIIVDASINSLELNKLDITAFDASWNDLSNNFVSRFGDTITGNYNITGDLYIDGSFTVLGGATFIQTQTVEISDNLLLINSNQTGTPPPTLQSGIEVNRGSENNYQFLFDETSDTFKIGEVGNLQSVATREDTPNNNRVPYWDNTETRFKTDRLITIDNSNNISLGSTPLNPYRLDIRNLTTNDTRVMINDCSQCITSSNAMLNLFIRENQTKEHIHFRRAFDTGGGTQIKDFGLSIDENAGLTVGKYDNNGNYEELLYVNENHTIEVDGTQGGDFVIVGTPNISLSGVNTNLSTNYYTKTQTDTLLNGKLSLTGGTIAPSFPVFPVPTLLTIDNGNLDIINNGKLLIGGVDVLGNIDASINAIDESKWTTNGNDIYNDNTGDVGIGLTNPDAKLDIFSTGVIGLKLKRNTGAGVNAPIIFRMINSTGDGDWNITIGDELLDNSIFAIHRYNTSITSAPFRITQGDDVEIENDLVVEGSISEGGTLLTSKYLQLSGGTMSGAINMGGQSITNVNVLSALALQDKDRATDRLNYISINGTTNLQEWLRFRRGGSPSGMAGCIFSNFGSNNFFLYNDASLKINHSNTNIDTPPTGVGVDPIGSTIFNLSATGSLDVPELKEGGVSLSSKYALIGSSGNWDLSGNNIYNNNSGNVGINRENPQLRMEISPIANASNQNNGLRLSTTGTVGTNSYRFADWKLKSDGSGTFRLGLDVNNDSQFSSVEDVISVRLAGGNVGIRTTSPEARLDLGNGGASYNTSFIWGKGSDNNFHMYGFEDRTSNATNAIIGGLGLKYSTSGINSSLRFHRGQGAYDGFMSFTVNNNTEVMRIASNGNVGIGTNNPANRLHLEGTTNGEEGLRIRNLSSGSSAFNIIRLATDNALAGLVIFINSTARTADGGTNTATIRNDNGDLQLQGKGAVGMRIKETTGRVGIGQSNPSQTQHITNGNESKTLYGPNTTWSSYLEVGAGTNNITTTKAQVISTNGNLHLDCASDKLMYLNFYANKNIVSNTGVSLALGQSSFSYLYRLWVNGDGTNTPQGTAGFYYQGSLGVSTVLDIRSNVGSTNRNVCKIRASGNIENINNSYGALSDIKFKTDIEDAKSQLEDIKNIRVVNFKMKLDETKHIGVIAQEIEKVCPYLVDDMPELDESGNEIGSYKTVKYSILYMKNIKATQELIHKVETLEEENKLLKDRLDRLEALLLSN